MGTAMKRPPSFPPLPPRNCLSVQFLPHVVRFSPGPVPVPVHLQLDRLPPCCSLYIWLLQKLLPASLRDLHNDVTVIKRI